MKINALGLTTVSSEGDILDVFFPFIKFGEDRHVGEKNSIKGFGKLLLEN